MLRGVGLSLGLVHSSRGMVRRGVDGDEAKRILAPVEEVVAGARAHEDHVIGADLARSSVELSLGAALDEDQDLIGVRMDFLADLAA